MRSGTVALRQTYNVTGGPDSHSEHLVNEDAGFMAAVFRLLNVVLVVVL